MRLADGSVVQRVNAQQGQPMLGTLSWYSWGSVYAVRSGNRTVLCLTFVKRFHSSGPPVDPVSVPCARRYRPGGSHSISGSSAMSGADGVPNPVLHVSGNPESAPRPDAVPSEPPTSAVAMPTGLQPQAHVRQPSRAAGNTGPSQPLPSDAFLLPVAVASSSSPDGQPQPGRGHVRAPSKQAAADHGGGRRSIRTHARAPSRYVMDADQQVHPTATFQLPSGVQDDDEPSGGRPRKDPQDLARKDRALPSAKQAALEQHMARSADSQLVVASPAPESRHSSGTGSNGASVKAGPAEPRSMKGGEARHRNGSPVSPGGDHRLQERRQVVARSSPVGVKPRLFVSLMIVTDVALCVYSMYLNGWQFESFSTNPLLGPSSSVLDGMGAKDTGRIRAGEWWRLVTAMCLHSGVLHLAVNMSMLWRLGGSLEQGFGFGRVAIVYVLAGISGDILSALFLPMQISVGASGALFGLLGALYGDLAHNYRLMEGSSFWYLVSLVLNTALGLAAGLLPLVDNFAHVGGFVCGLLVGSCVLVDPHHARRSRSMPWYSAPLRIVSATLAVLWFIMLIWVFAWDVDPNRICGWCRALGCLPTPYWSCCVPHVDPATGRTVPC